MAWQDLIGHDVSDPEFWMRRGFTQEDLDLAQQHARLVDAGGGQQSFQAQAAAAQGSAPANVTPGPASTPDMLVALAQAQASGNGGMWASQTPAQGGQGPVTGPMGTGDWDFSGPGGGQFDPNVYQGGPGDNFSPGAPQQIPGQENAGVDPQTGLIVWRAGDEARYYPSP